MDKIMSKDEDIKKAIPGQRYKHYKGGLYVVLHLSKHTETDELLVIYQSLHFGTYYARLVTNTKYLFLQMYNCALAIFKNF
jgi:hypothetical protein